MSPRVLAKAILFYIPNTILGKTWPVDFIWSTYPILQFVLIILGEKNTNQFTFSQLIVLLTITLWGLRLTINFIARGGNTVNVFSYINFLNSSSNRGLIRLWLVRRPKF